MRSAPDNSTALPLQHRIERTVKIILASPIAPETIEHLSARHDVVIGFDGPDALASGITDREAVVVRSGVTLTSDLLGTAGDLRLIVRAGSGFDNIDLGHARDRGIRVARVPGPSAQAVAELTFGLILAVSRKIVHADRQLRQGRWPKHQLGGNLLHGKVLGVVGAGRIGGRVGELGAAWGMRAIGCIGEDDTHLIPGLEARGIAHRDFGTVVSESDIVTVHTPLNDATRGLIDAVVLGKMKPGAMLVNTSRGGVVDETALYDALVNGHLIGAALDVHEREGEGVIPRLAELPNVVMTPHIGGMALESQSIIGRRVVELVDAFVDGTFDDTVTPDESIV